MTGHTSTWASTRHIAAAVSAVLLTLFTSAPLAAQTPFPPPPPDDNNWSGFITDADGPFPNGPRLSTTAPNGHVYTAAPVGSGVQVAHWDGVEWTVLGDRLQRVGAINTSVFDMAADGNGDLYLSGNFTEAINGDGTAISAPYIVRWDAAADAWAAVGQGTDVAINDLAIDATGDRVYVVGPASGYDGNGNPVAINGVGYWDRAQSTWGAVGGGVDGFPQSILADGAGNVYVGGPFLDALASDGSRITVNGLGRWDGSTWHILGQGLASATQTYPTELTFAPNGDLLVGGFFDEAVNGDGSRVPGPAVRWDGTVWQSLNHPPAFTVEALVCDGSGNVYTLYDDPNFTGARVGRFDGAQWDVIARLRGEVLTTISASPNYATTDLYLGGLYFAIENPATGQVSSIFNNGRWNGQFWRAMQGRYGSNGIVNALAEKKYPVSLVVGGNFSSIGNISAANVAIFDGRNWSSPGGGVNGIVHAISAGFRGFRPVTAVGGEFSQAIQDDGSAITVNGIAAWTDRQGWLPLGLGVNGPVYAIINTTSRFSGGLLGSIIVGGDFNAAFNADGTPVQARGLARWDWISESWSAVGNGMAGSNPVVRVLAQDARHPYLDFYAGGSFDGGINDDNSTVASRNVIKWQTSGPANNWVAMGQGVDGPVLALAHHRGPGIGLSGDMRVWVGGDFQGATNANGSAVNTPFLAIWNGNSNQWNAVAGGTNGIVRSIEPITSSTYQGAFIGGDFTLGYYANGNARGINHVGLFRLQPTRYNQRPLWNELGTNAINGPVRALKSINPCYGGGENVFAGGDFTQAGFRTALHLAKWRYRWHPTIRLVSGVASGGGGTGGGVRGVAVFRGCSFLTNKMGPPEVLFDSLAFGASIPLDTLPLFQPFDLTLYDVDNPGFPIARFDSLVIDNGTPMNLMLTGVDDTTGYAPNPDGRSIALTPRVIPLPADSGQAGEVLVQFVHAATDAPTIDIAIQGGATLVSGLGYGETGPAVSLLPDVYTLDLLDGGQAVGSFTIDVSGDADRIILAAVTGFLDPAANQNGPPLGLDAIDSGQPLVAIGDDGERYPLPPAGFRLKANYPNPFNPSTTMAFEMGAAGSVTLKVYDVLGREVVTLVDGWRTAGTHRARWNGRDADGRPVASGMYLYRLSAGDGFTQTRRMLLVR